MLSKFTAFREHGARDKCKERSQYTRREGKPKTYFRETERRSRRCYIKYMEIMITKDVKIITETKDSLLKMPSD
jgi:hypothetical protein